MPRWEADSGISRSVERWRKGPWSGAWNLQGVSRFLLVLRLVLRGEVASLLDQLFDRIPQKGDSLPARQTRPLRTAGNPGLLEAVSEDP